MADLDKNVLLDWLPEVYRDTPVENLLNIISGMFAGFHEHIDKLPDSVSPGADFFALPTEADKQVEAEQKKQYLDWFAGWMNLVLSEEWDHEHKREILKKILPLYKKRGTLEGLAEYLRIYAGGSITIMDDHPPLQIDDIHSSIVGVNMIIGGFPPDIPAMVMGNVSTLGDDSIIEGFSPYFFIVRAAVSESGPAALRAKRKAITRILEMEKPAHTWYRLTVTGPTFKLHDVFEEAVATLGHNTII